MSNNKKNHLRLLGFKSLTFLALIFVVSGWFASVQYIAEQTEERIKATLAEQHKTSSNSFYLELVSYERSFFGAQVITRLRSYDSSLNEVVNELVFRADIKHGPLLFNAHNVQLAMASMNVYIDKSLLSEDTGDLITRLFGDKQPFSASVLLDYNLRYFYQLSSAPLHYEVADMELKVSSGIAEGVYETDRNEIDINFLMDEISFRQGVDSLESLNNKFVLNVLNQSGDMANVGLKQTMHSSIAMTNKTSYAGLSINLAQLQLNKLFGLIDHYEDRYNLDQQIEWTLEVSSQYQEGQDRLLELFSQQDDVLLPETDDLITQLFKKGTSDISYLRKVEHQDTDIAYNYSVK